MIVPLVAVAVLAFVVLVIYLVLALVQLRRTLQRVDTLVVNTERELTPLLANLRESSEHLRESVSLLEHGLQRATTLLVAVGEVGDSIHAVNEALREGVSRYLDQAAAILAGFKVFRRFFRKQHHSEEGE